MITGTVTAYREAIIRLNVRGPGGGEKTVEAVIDTGFDGILTLSTSVVAALGLPWRTRERAILADGSVTMFNMYEASVLWDGKLRRVLVQAVNTTPLVGMGMLEGYELRIEAVAGGRVVITKLSKQRVP